MIAATVCIWLALQIPLGIAGREVPAGARMMVRFSPASEFQSGNSAKKGARPNSGGGLAIGRADAPGERAIQSRFQKRFSNAPMRSSASSYSCSSLIRRLICACSGVASFGFAAGAALKSGEVAQTLLDVFALLFGALFIALWFFSICFSIFILLCAV